MPTRKMVIPSDLEAARAAEQTLLDDVARHGYKDTVIFAIKLALEEGLNNAIKHGNGYDHMKHVEIGYAIDSQQAVITITDEGRGFNPGAVPDPTADENLEKPCGRGIMLMKAYMDQVSFNADGNQVQMIKRNT